MDSCFKPGDKPPKGYLAWHEWAAVQYAAGIRQKPCKKCGLYLTPQEVDDHMARHFADGIAVDALTANVEFSGGAPLYGAASAGTQGSAAGD